MLDTTFFDQDPLKLANALLGKVIRHKVEYPIDSRQYHWLSARIIETEAYFLNDKASHSSLGFTEKRKAMFMSPGTIYMYFARGGDSLNFSARGEGNAVLIKSARPHVDQISPASTIDIMHKNNPINGRKRPPDRLCSGQTLLCRSLGLKVHEWDQQVPDRNSLTLEDTGYTPEKVIRCPRLGISTGRDEHLPYRFIDFAEARFTTSPTTTKNPNQMPGMAGSGMAGSG